MKSKNRLVFRIILPVLTVTLVGLASLGLLMYQGVRSKMIALETETLLEASTYYMTEVQKEKHDLVTILDFLLEDIRTNSRSNLSSESEIRMWLQNLVNANELSNMALLHTNGEVIVSVVEDTFSLPSERAAISEAQSGGIHPVITAGNGKICTTGITKIQWQDTEVLFLIQRNLTDINLLQDAIMIPKTDVSIYLNQDRVGTTIHGNSSSSNAVQLNEAIARELYTGDGTYTGLATVDGVQYLTVYTRLVDADLPASTNIAIAAVKEFSAVSAAYMSILSTSMFQTALLLGIIAVLIIAMLSSLILRPINSSIDAFKSLNGGSGQADLTYRIGVRREDEIGVMCSEVNQFIGTQQHIMLDVEKSSKDITEATEALASSAQETASSTHQISANISSVNQQVLKQNTALEEVQQILQDSVEGIHSLDSLIENQSSGIVESSSAIEQMVGNISSVSHSVNKMAEEYQQLIDITDTGRQRQDEVAKQIHNMAEESRHLAEANNVISQIASQTNLLAMNAAIEAAHAGEAGQGFSVVADEIRKLAENSATQSKAIKAELVNISNIIQNVVNTSSLSVQEFEQITGKVASTDRLVREIDNAMVEQQEASKQVLASLRDINNTSMEVRQTSKKMAHNISRLENSATNLDFIATTVANSMTEMDSGIKEIGRAAQSVADQVMRAKDSVNVMDAILQKFKLKE